MFEIKENTETKRKFELELTEAELIFLCTSVGYSSMADRKIIFSDKKLSFNIKEEEFDEINKLDFIIYEKLLKVLGT